MTYLEFSNIFLLKLASSFRSGFIKIHGLVDFDLWKKTFPDDNSQIGQVIWSNINFNAFKLNDEQESLLIVYTIPIANTSGEAKFIAFRLNKKRDSLLLYSLRRPKFFDDPWDIFQYDFKAHQNIYIKKIGGTDSLREFKASIENLEYKETTPIINKIKTLILF